MIASKPSRSHALSLQFFSTWFKPAPDSRLIATRQQGRAAWTHAVHLLWTAWVFLVPLFTPEGYDLRWLLLTLLSYPLFVVLSVTALLVPARWVNACGVGIIAMTFALLPWYPSGLTYFVFGCVMLRQERLWNYLLQVLLLNAALMAFARWIGYPWASLAWMPVTTLVVGTLIHVERSNQRKDAALRLSHDEVRRLAAGAERERIGRDLHDLLGHTLSLITLKLELARKLSERDPDASRREMAEAERVARDALAEVRSAVTGYRAADLAGELAAARLMLESSQVRLDYAPAPPMPVATERALALVLREAATNIARHARATQAWIAFARDGDAVQVKIEDDGRGGVVADGNGLGGMRERIAELGGTLSVDSPKGRGTRVLVRVPCKRGAETTPGAAPI